MFSILNLYVDFPEFIWYWSFSEILFLTWGISGEFWGDDTMIGNMRGGKQWVSGGQLLWSLVTLILCISLARCLPRCSLTGRAADPQINLRNILLLSVYLPATHWCSNPHTWRSIFYSILSTFKMHGSKRVFSCNLISPLCLHVNGFLDIFLDFTRGTYDFMNTLETWENGRYL